MGRRGRPVVCLVFGQQHMDIIWSELITHTLQIYISPVTHKSVTVKHLDKRRINECAQQSQSQTIFGLKNIHHIIFQTCTYVGLTSHVVVVSCRERERVVTLLNSRSLVSSNPCRTDCIVTVKAPVFWDWHWTSGLTTLNLSSCQLKSSTGDKA